MTSLPPSVGSSPVTGSAKVVPPKENNTISSQLYNCLKQLGKCLTFMLPNTTKDVGGEISTVQNPLHTADVAANSLEKE